MTAAAMLTIGFLQRWLGLLALALAAVAAIDFIAFMSVSGQIPKAIAYQPDLLFEVYSWSPMISGSTGAVAAVTAIIALRLTAGPVWAPIVGATIGAALFNAVMVVVAQIMFMAAPTSNEGKDLTVPSFPSFTFSPPALAMEVLVIGAAVILIGTKGSSGRRAAIAALIMGTAVAFYWLFNLVWSVNAE